MKKLILVVCVMLFVFTSLYADSIPIDTSKTLIYKFDIKEEIGPAIWRQTMQSFEKANELNADYVLIHMNTYGGLVDAADSIRTIILNSEIPVMVFIDNNAASAGALISIACDSIYMRSGANIGAATVVDQSGQPVPDKYQSYMRSMMRSTAEAHGKDTIINGNDTIYKWHRDPRIAEAMVDPDKRVEGVIDSSEVLTFTTSEAIKFGFCEGEANNIKEVIAVSGITDYQIYEYKPTSIEKIIGILVSPYLQGILIMIMIGGIYFELQSPGVGFPLIASAIAAILYFAPLYLEGLAENWEIVIFIVGVILLLVEIFAIPGFGVAGISGIVLMVTGLTMSMIDNVVFDFETDSLYFLHPLFRSLLIVVASMTISVFFSIILARQILETKAFEFMILQKSTPKKDGYLSVDSSYSYLIGKKGLAYTVLRPSGKVEIDNEIYDAVALIGYIEKNTSIIVTKHESGQLYVNKIN